MPYFLVVCASVAGAVLSSLLACLPGLHVYNVMGAMVMVFYALADRGITMAPEVFLPFMASNSHFGRKTA